MHRVEVINPSNPQQSASPTKDTTSPSRLPVLCLHLRLRLYPIPSRPIRFDPLQAVAAARFAHGFLPPLTDDGMPPGSAPRERELPVTGFHGVLPTNLI